VPHQAIDVVSMDMDFLVFSGHKMMASTGVGVLYGKKALLETMAPYRYGGDMNEYVEEQVTTFAKLPSRLEAGTPNIEGVISLGAAIDYINHIGMDTIHNHEMMLTQYALLKLSELDYVNIIGTTDIQFKGPVISFNIRDVHSHDTAFILDNAHIAIRSGHHCAQPLMHYMKVPSTARISFYIYNNTEDVDQLITHLKEVRRWLGYGS
jgi:cysteine desulfurase/selenocysteine lyase